jgi:beta-glucosidase
VRASGTGATVTVRVANTGRRRGTDVPQLYLGLPQPRASVVQPPRQLKGFQRVTLGRGKATRVRFAIDRRALSYWDTGAHGWRVAPGCYRVAVGRSSRDIAQRATLAVGRASCFNAVASVPASGG